MRFSVYVCASLSFPGLITASVSGDEHAAIGTLRKEKETLQADSESGQIISPDEVIISVNEGNDSSSYVSESHELQPDDNRFQSIEITEIPTEEPVQSFISVIVNGSNTENHVLDSEVSQTFLSEINPDDDLVSYIFSFQQEQLNDYEMKEASNPTTAKTIQATKLTREAVCSEVCRRTPGCYSDHSGSSSYCKTWQNPKVCYGLYWRDASLTSTCYHLYSDSCPERWPVMCEGPILNLRSSTSDTKSRIELPAAATETRAPNPDGSATIVSSVESPNESEECTIEKSLKDVIDSQIVTAEGGKQPADDSSIVEFKVHEEITLNHFDESIIENSTQSTSVSVIMSSAISSPTVATESLTSEKTKTAPSSTSPLLATGVSPKLTSSEAGTNRRDADLMSIIVHSTDKPTSQSLRKWKTCQALCDTLDDCKGGFGSTCLLNNRNQQQSCYGIFYTDAVMSRMCYAPKDMNCPNDYPVPCP